MPVSDLNEESLYTEMRRRFKGAFCRRLGQDWEDAFHEIFAQCLEKIHNGEVRHPLTYTSHALNDGSVYWLWDARRKANRERTILDAGGERARDIDASYIENAPQEESLIRAERLDAVRDAVNSISNPMLRQVARRVWLLNEDNETGMAAMGMTEGAWRCAKNRAKVALIERIRCQSRKPIGVRKAA